jgi:hypothetical protein
MIGVHGAMMVGHVNHRLAVRGWTRLDREHAAAGRGHPSRRHERAQEEREGERKQDRQARLTGHGERLRPINANGPLRK